MLYNFTSLGRIQNVSLECVEEIYKTKILNLLRIQFFPYSIIVIPINNPLESFSHSDEPKENKIHV